MYDQSIGQQLAIEQKKSKRYFYLSLKRLFDIILSSILLLLIWPLFVVVAILIKIDSKGPVFLNQKRLGKDGKLFKIYKFRSMVDHAEDVLEEMMENDPKIRLEYETNKKLENDPRVTRIGKFIRKTSIDELPQILNIFHGDMSFVGPRPYLIREIKELGSYYNQIVKMAPGLTGLWQVSGRSDCAFEDRLKLDYKYYYNRGLKKDFEIVLKTFKVVLKGKGAK